MKLFGNLSPGLDPGWEFENENSAQKLSINRKLTNSLIHQLTNSLTYQLTN
jgi:hypothetical protein